MARILFLGQILQVTANPFLKSNPEEALSYIPKGALCVEGDRIVAVGEAAALKRQFADATPVDHGEAVIVPGFIDTHVHFPQISIIGRHSGELLSWLDNHAFPAELKYAERAYADEAADLFCRELWRHGITAGAVFSSVHYEATDAIFSAFARKGGRAVIGKVSMDRHAPKGLTEDPEEDLAHTHKLIDAWHGYEDRLFYALTPRFAPSCSDKLMRQLGDLKSKRSNLYVQSHHGENKAELAWVKELYPKAPHYLGVYDHYGLLGPKTLLAHCIYANEAELSLFKSSQTVMVHCPTSNTFLGSGLFPLKKRLEGGFRVSLGTDIGGGTSFSMWQTMAEANKVAKLLGDPVDPAALLYTATLGGAEALGLEKSLGSFAVGKQADFQVMRWQNDELSARVFAGADSPTQKLSTLIHFGAPALLDSLYVGGKSKISGGKLA